MSSDLQSDLHDLYQDEADKDKADQDNIDQKNIQDRKKIKKKDRDIIVEVEGKNKELDSKYKRALADYQNLLRTSAEDKKEFLKYALEEFLLDILPIYDNLNISISNLTEEQSKNPWVEGVKYIIKQFDDFFVKKEVEKIKTVGEVFDYYSMEAVEGEGEKVVREVRPGYKLKDKVIIPARVVVGDKK